LATGELDSAGDLIFNVKGSREEVTQQLFETAKAWGISMTREEAATRADAAIVAAERRPWWHYALGGTLVALILYFLINSTLIGLLDKRLH
jgi:hypothetical protein